MKQIPISQEQRLELGRQYCQEVERVRQDRAPRIETYRQAQEDYEGKAPPLDFPWPDNVSSNAVIPLIPTHVNAIRARLYNTATGQDPIFYPQLTGVAPVGPGEGLDRDEFGRAWAKLSEWAEKKDVPVRHILNQAIHIQVKYGDAIIYCPWMSRERYDYTYDPIADEWIKSEDPVETLGKPRLRVIHPENFYIPTFETDIDSIQTAKFVAYDFELSYDEIRHYREDGTFDPQCADQLMELLRPKEAEQKYGIKDSGDPLHVGRSDDDRTARQQRIDIGLNDEIETGKLRFYHVWASEDMDDDGYEEEIQFFVHATSGIVPHITWNYYDHHKRPFVKLSYEERDGQFYSIGIPEMLANIQKIMNEIIRDVLNNNKVQNTKLFLVRKNAGIDPETRLWPGRMLFLDNPAGDFIPQDMGTGRQVTSINDMFTLQQWAERRDSIIDFNLGQERTSRTPATTTLALLEEANKTLDMIIRRMRMALEDLWDMVLSLYVQYGFPDGAMETLVGNNVDLVTAAIDDMTVGDLRNNLRFYARVNTQNLNRSVRRQEALTEFGTIREMNAETLGIIGAIKQNMDDPALVEVLKGQYRGLHRIMGRFLDTFDEYNQDEVNANYLDLLEEVQPSVPIGTPSLDQQPTQGPAGPVEQALGASTAAGKPSGPIAPPGRPVSGQQRVPQGTPEERNLI